MLQNKVMSYFLNIQQSIVSKMQETASVEINVLKYSSCFF